MVKIVLPISCVDAKLAYKLAERFISFGIIKDVTVVYCWSDQWDAEIVVDLLKKNGVSVTTRQIMDVPENGKWPDAPNHMFCEGATWLYDEGNTDPWYWFEADNFPLRPDFLEVMNKEYEEAGKPYMGFLNDSRYVINGVDVVDGQHMVGTGIYPANFLEICESVSYIPEGMPWDLHIRDEVVPKCHNTKLIHHAFRTGRYAIENGVLTGQDLEKRGNSYAGPVAKEVVLIHGCKDLSLYDIDFST